MKINDDLSNLTRWEYISLLNCLICYFNSQFDEHFPLFEEFIDRKEDFI